MKLIRYLHNLKANQRGCVATIGNFDGVHQGHEAVIGQLREQGQELKLPAIVMLFEPQPLEFFSPESAPARLTSFREKFELLKKYGIDRLLCLRFKAALASLSAEAFIKQLLVEGLDTKRLIVGDDFRFGQGRKGDIDMLVRSGQDYGFEVIPTRTYNHEGIRVSSSRIREYLAAGEFQKAKAMLGRPYSISGKVIRGDQRGRQLGFPTANIALRHIRLPLSGVYVVRIHGLGKVIHTGVANIGTRPVFGGKKVLLEIHLFEFERDIYGHRIEVEFLKFIRAEMRFASPGDLQEQIKRDIRESKNYLKDAAIANS